jgi:hypothetical protein
LTGELWFIDSNTSKVEMCATRPMTHGICAPLHGFPASFSPMIVTLEP